MTIDRNEFAAWAARHRTLFGLNYDDISELLAEWFRSFAAMGFSACELNKATDMIVSSPAGWPTWRDQHLRRIVECVQRQRAERQAAADRRYVDEHAKSACTVCDDTGQVAGLPQLSEVRDGQWRGAKTCAVLCVCHRGQRMLESRHAREWGSEDLRERACYTLREYELANPYWRDQIHAHWQATITRRRAEDATRRLDALRGPLRAVSTLGAALKEVSA